MKVVISSGHGKYVRGAVGIIDEVDEARKVVEAVARYLRKLGVGVETFHDDVSETQDENLERIVMYHNGRNRDLDISVHFNCYDGSAHGTEVLYVTADELAEDVSAVLADAGGFTNRGAKYRGDLYFLNQTDPTTYGAILIETCFVDSVTDTDLYREHFEDICSAIADTVAALSEIDIDDQVTFVEAGKCSWFGGPNDTGVDPDEDLAWFDSWDDVVDAGATHLFLPEQPPGTTGLARRLDPTQFYVACRWDYEITPKDMLADQDILALIRAKKTGKEFLAHPADWGPHEDTDRAADISPGLMAALGIETDDEIEVIYPAFVYPAPRTS